MRAVWMLLLLLPLFLSACAQTKIESYVDPQYKKENYDSIVVMSNLGDLAQRRYLESAVCKQFESAAAQCIPSAEVNPPTQELSAAQVTERIRASGAGAIVIVQFKDAYTDSSYVPEQSTTTGSATTYGNTTYVQGNTISYGGYTVKKPREQYRIEVFDVDDQRKAMVASALTKGGASANTKMLSDSLAKALVKELVANGLIRKPSGGDEN